VNADIMIVADKLIFLELQKTGCTHIAELLKKSLPCEQIGKHNRLPADFPVKSRLVVGSVRNPWDWYVSLWTYGCGGQGGLYRNLTQSWSLTGHGLRQNLGLGLARSLRDLGRPRHHWRMLYADCRDAGRFRDWLRLILDHERRHDLREGYGESAISQLAGLMTYRYFYLFSRDAAPLYSPAGLASLDDLRALDAENNVLGAVIRNERLQDDLIATLRTAGYPLEEKDYQAIATPHRTNASKRIRRLDYYYDPETAALVQAKEAFLIQKYGYRFGDSIRG
jgi:hypothetical protein